MKAFFLLLGLTAWSGTARAEIFQLLDNTQVSGKLLHYYEGVFHVETANGQKIELPTSKLKAITFKLPPPRAEFSTPEKTFNRYKEALLKSDITKLIECYALMYQGMLAAQLSQSSDDFQKMKKEMEGVKFVVKDSKITGSSATLKVARVKGDDSETADIKMVLENGEWKMTP